MKKTLARAFLPLLLFGLACGKNPPPPPTHPEEIEAYGWRLFAVTERLESAARDFKRAEDATPTRGGPRALMRALHEARLAREKLPEKAPPELAACDRATREAVRVLIESTAPVQKAFDDSLQAFSGAEREEEKTLRNLAGASALYEAWAPAQGAIKKALCHYQEVYEGCRATAAKEKVSFPPFPRATWQRLGC